LIAVFAAWKDTPYFWAVRVGVRTRVRARVDRRRQRPERIFSGLKTPLETGRPLPPQVDRLVA
jgi:hypothetical protein